jgi:hypothetical protein
MKRWFGGFAIGLAGLASMIAAASARITHIEIIKSEPAFGGQPFGAAGAYERLTGRVTGELDPADPAHSGIQDVNLAPRNDRGMVEYVTNIELLKPADVTKGNRILFFEVDNRGNKLAPQAFNAGVAGGVADRNALSSPGDGWLRALCGRFLPTLTVRAREQDPREPIPNSAWSFGTCDQGGASTPDEKHLCYPDGFKPGRLYELIYRAKDPTVGGLGFAAARDLGAFLRNSDKDDVGTANPVYRPDNLAIIEGSSQSGRMIRSLLALGFNRDETGRRVFDGAFPHIGGGLMPLNVRFGQPVRAWGEQTDHLYPAYDFPFTYARQTDPLTERTEGLFDRCDATDTCPKLFHVATALEMWEGRQSLGLTDPLGRTDVADPPNVRTYIMASTQHGAAPLPLAAHAPFGNCQQQPNPNPQIWTMRALMTALTGWVRDGVEPPPSAKPSIADATLVAPDRVRFPEIPANFYGEVDRPAVSPLRIYDTLHVLDFGPLYRAEDSSGVITREPPKVGSGSYGILETQVDADGNDLAGIRSVFLQTPIGTYTGWNLGRKDRFENGMCNLQGSFIPFAATKAERIATGDPRLSLEERYPSKDVYLAAFKKAADDLVAKRFLLSGDADALLKTADSEGVRNAP